MRKVAVVSAMLCLLASQAFIPVAQADGCRFVLGFAAIQAEIPATVGQCREDESHNPANGDAIQQTTDGMLVWRHADNFTAFTDGYWSWVNGPYGLQKRLNSQRFAWEARADDESNTVVDATPGVSTSGNSTSVDGADGATGSSSSTITSNVVVSGGNGSPASSNQPGGQATYRICNAANAPTEQAIANLIAGRSFSSTLTGRSDGCADLTISVPDGSSVLSAGSQASQDLSVNGIAVRIISQAGTTQVHVGG